MFVFFDFNFNTLCISIISFHFFLQMVKSYIGSLHTPEVIEKFRKLGASQEVLLVLQQGLFMPYEESLIPKNEFFTHNKGDCTCLSSSVCFVYFIHVRNVWGRPRMTDKYGLKDLLRKSRVRQPAT